MEAAPDPGPRLCCKPGGRLDMSHGFVHHIRRNQLARDDYDKKVKQAAKEKARRRHTPAPARPRKPDLQVYLPRRRGEAARRARALLGSGPSASTRPLLSGKTHTTPFPRLGSSRPLPEPPPRRSPDSAQCCFLENREGGRPPLRISVAGPSGEPAGSCGPVCPPHCLPASPLPHRERLSQPRATGTEWWPEAQTQPKALSPDSLRSRQHRNSPHTAPDLLSIKAL
ncbi:UPF0561 protein C2orf68 homolog isoform X1 [Myotis daubentonii]|uniref:UPF0561 protein C2orf68 homolog isoform X1 n=1 Tax=Myotis daubentonii TaxID=98922 RepID=UPI0028730159|nr:UPF0561 protein C2orf68 homolog isoform X1 [Myotis daubentonii]